VFLLTDTDVSNGHVPSIFRVEVYRFRKFCEEIVHETRGRIRMGSLIRPVGRVGNGTAILRGIQAFFACVTDGKWDDEKRQSFSGTLFSEEKSRILR
jgi:hypothetical protein